MSANLLELSERHAVSIHRLDKAYGSGVEPTLALEGLDLEVRRGEFVCLVGASGSGKSTLLSILAGLESPTSGWSRVRGRVGLLFQEPALLPWLTAAGNVELALELRGVGRKERRRQARELLRRVHLEGSETRRPHQLSGGMRQRVALARALSQDADVLLMDEPFGSLDAISRDHLHRELELIWSEAGLTVLFVTHNTREAVRLGDRVLVFSSRPGRIAAEFSVPLPRPRSLDAPEVALLSGRISERLRLEIADGR